MLFTSISLISSYLKKKTMKNVGKITKCDIMKSAKRSHSGQSLVILGLSLMYISSKDDQLTITDFFMPFGGFGG